MKVEKVLKQVKVLKKIAAFCLVLNLVLSGCGQASSGKNVDMNKLREDMIAADTQLPDMLTVTEESDSAEASFAVLADFDFEKVERFFYCYSESGSPEEIAVIQLKDKGDAADLMTALNQHIESRKSTFQQYSPEQVDMVEKAVLTFEENYVTLIISAKCGAVQDVFKAALA